MTAFRRCLITIFCASFLASSSFAQVGNSPFEPNAPEPRQPGGYRFASGDSPASYGDQLAAVDEKLDRLQAGLLGGFFFLVLFFVVLIAFIFLVPGKNSAAQLRSPNAELKPAWERRPDKPSQELALLEEIKTTLAHLRSQDSGAEFGRRIESVALSVEDINKRIGRLETTWDGFDERMARLDERSASLQEMEQGLSKDRASLSEEFNQLSAMKRELNTREMSLVQQCTELESLKSSIAQREEVLLLAQADLTQREEILRSREETCSAEDKALAAREVQLDAREEKVTDAVATLRSLQEDLWPKEFFREPLSSWRERIESDLQRSDPLARIVWLAIGRVTAMASLQDDLETRRSLHDLGRWAYRYWASTGMDKSNQFAAAKEWASAFDSVCDGEYRLRVVEPGVIRDRSWMDYSARAVGTHAQEVHGWCVLDRDGRTMDKADVG